MGRDTVREQKVAWLAIAGSGLVAIGALVATVITAKRLAFVPHASSEAERASGVLRGYARFEPQAPTPVPPCLAHFKRDDENGYSHFNGDSRVFTRDGDEYVLPETSTIEFFGNVPPETSEPVTETVEAYQQFRRPDVKVYESVRCLAPTKEVWVEACANGETLVGCSEHSDRVLITVGGPAVRAHSLASDAHGLASLSLFAAVFGSVVSALSIDPARHRARAMVRGGKAMPSVRAIVGGALGAVFVGIAAMLVTTTVGGGLFGLVMGAGLAAASLLVTRARRFSLARGELRRDSSELHPLVGREEGDLQVAIPEDAPTIEGFDPGATAGHAAVRFRIVERCEEPRADDDGTNTALRTVLEGWHPERVEISDRSGRGTLSLARCDVELEPRSPREIKDESELPAWFRDGFQLPAPSPHHAAFVCEWSVLERGDSLVVFGATRTIEPAKPPDRRGEGKRAAQSRLDGPLRMFVGKKDELKSEAGRGFRRQIGALLVWGVASAAAAALFFWILRMYGAAL